MWLRGPTLGACDSRQAWARLLVAVRHLRFTLGDGRQGCADFPFLGRAADIEGRGYTGCPYNPLPAMYLLDDPIINRLNSNDLPEFLGRNIMQTFDIEKLMACTEPKSLRALNSDLCALIIWLPKADKEELEELALILPVDDAFFSRDFSSLTTFLCWRSKGRLRLVCGGYEAPYSSSSNGFHIVLFNKESAVCATYRGDPLYLGQLGDLNTDCASQETFYPGKDWIARFPVISEKAIAKNQFCEPGFADFEATSFRFQKFYRKPISSPNE